MMRYFFFLLLCHFSAFAQVNTDIFKQHGVTGSTTIYDYQTKKWIYSDSLDAQRAMQPASTFKIINFLIGLETKTIKDENAIISWPGQTDTTLYGYRPDIYKNISIKEAFEVSAGWAFIEIAKNISRKTYLSYLRRSAYGNLDLSEKGDDFWNFGPMKVTPQQQVAFLVKVYENKTIFSRRNTDILKQVMITTKKPGITVRSKTGWTRTEGRHIGWWTGYVEYNGQVYFFCTRITMPLGRNTDGFRRARKLITAEVLKGLYGVEI